MPGCCTLQCTKAPQKSMFTCHTWQLLFLVLCLSPLLSLFLSQLLLNLVLLHREVILTAALVTNIKQFLLAGTVPVTLDLFVCCSLFPQKLGLGRNIPTATKLLRLLMVSEQ